MSYDTVGRSLCVKKEEIMYLIVGLGNPGTEYAATRHNIGFDMVTYLSDQYNIPLRSRENKAHDRRTEGDAGTAADLYEPQRGECPCHAGLL